MSARATISTVALCAALAALALAGPVAASADSRAAHADTASQAAPEGVAAGAPVEVVALEQATAELGRAKRANAAAAARRARAAAAVLAPCRRSGPGWRRIRAVRHASQRARYAAAARRLLADMGRLLTVQQPLIAAHGDAFAGFVERLRRAPVHDRVLSEAVAAQGRRLAAYREIAGVVADCAVFNRALRAVREFPTRSASQIIRADYRVSPRARRIERVIARRLRAIERRHGIRDRDADTLAAAAGRMVALGGAPGYATGFQYALSLR